MIQATTKRILLYKLAVELLFLLALGSAVFFLGEMILPGFVSSRINFSTPYFALILALFIVFFLGGPHMTKAPAKKLLSSRSILFPGGISLLLTLLLANDMHGLSLPRSILLLACIFVVIFSILSIFFLEEKTEIQK